MRLSFVLCLLTVVGVLAGCGTNNVQTPPPSQVRSKPPVAIVPPTLQAEQETPAEHDFSRWLEGVKNEARQKNISEAVLEDAFAGIFEPSDSVLTLDQKQPEKTKSFTEYEEALVTEKKITAARDKWRSHQQLLGDLENTYGVPAPVLLALWGMESNFGERQGSFSIIESLTTLAYDGRRSKFFRTELFNALTILQQEHMDAENLTGSWAGAMGQIQFMPSSFLAFAVDYDHDGKKDIWKNDADALASMANYLSQRGWNRSIGWGMAVALPDGDSRWQRMNGERSLAEWGRLGIRARNGNDLPQSPLPARLVFPDDNPFAAFLVFANYDVIMDWNHSTYFASAVGLLADAIGRQ